MVDHRTLPSNASPRGRCRNRTESAVANPAGTAGPTGETGAEDLRLEYAQLREELRCNEALMLQILAAAVLLIGSLTAVAFSEAVRSDLARGALILLTNVVALLAVSQRTALERQTHRIAAYLAVFVEACLPGARYETRLIAFRLHTRRRYAMPRWLKAFTSSGRFFYHATILASLVAGSFYLRAWARNESTWGQDAAAVAWVLIVAAVDVAVLVVHAREYGKFQLGDGPTPSAYHAYWKQVRDGDDGDDGDDADAGRPHLGGRFSAG